MLSSILQIPYLFLLLWRKRSMFLAGFWNDSSDWSAPEGSAFDLYKSVIAVSLGVDSHGEISEERLS